MSDPVSEPPPLSDQHAPLSDPPPVPSTQGWRWPGLIPPSQRWRWHGLTAIQWGVILGLPLGLLLILWDPLGRRITMTDTAEKACRNAIEKTGRYDRYQFTVGDSPADRWTIEVEVTQPDGSPVRFHCEAVRTGDRTVSAQAARR